MKEFPSSFAFEAPSHSIHVEGFYIGYYSTASILFLFILCNASTPSVVVKHKFPSLDKKGAINFLVDSSSSAKRTAYL